MIKNGSPKSRASVPLSPFLILPAQFVHFDLTPKYYLLIQLTPIMVLKNDQKSILTYVQLMYCELNNLKMMLTT